MTSENALSDRVSSLDTRLNRVESNIVAGFDRLEQLLRHEINDLKTEQINDLREANKRLGDDQRRVWEAVEAIRRSDERRAGAIKTVSTFSHFIATIFGGAVAAVATWFSHK